MKLTVDHVLVGNGAAVLLAAGRFLRQGESVIILNPDTDFFLENSELPLDLFSFESGSTDIHQRFSSNLPEQIYRDLISEFPGAVEIAATATSHAKHDYQVESAPWIRQRQRLWVAPTKTRMQDKMEALYLQVLDLGWKPQWLEGAPLAKRFPGFSAKQIDGIAQGQWSGFIGPRFGDVDVARYRTGLLEYLREKLGREFFLTSTRILDIKGKGVMVQGPHGPPGTIECRKSTLFFWTPKLERMLKNLIERHAQHLLPILSASVTKQLWEEWDLVSRDPVNSQIVAHFGGIRIWASGEGPPPPQGFSRIKIMRRENSSLMLSDTSLQEMFRMIFGFMSWDRFTVRSMVKREIYRWHDTSAVEWGNENLSLKLIRGCDGPIHWIANCVRKALDQP